MLLACCMASIVSWKSLILPLFRLSRECSNLQAWPRGQKPVLENSKQGFGLGRNSDVVWAKVQSAPILHSLVRQNLHMRVNCTAFFFSALVMLAAIAPQSGTGCMFT